jgi:ABC-type multidrug transport system permease subunit
MSGVFSVFWREMVILRRRLRRTLASYAMSPVLFLVAFGWGMGRGVNVEGVDYLTFMIPGLLALASMSQSFTIAVDLNVARFYWKTFEELQTAPVSDFAISLGEVLAGMVRGLLAGTVILLLAKLSGVAISYSWLLLLSVLLNTFLFASAGVMASMVVRSHADQSSLTTFIIVPMSFLCGTFFPLDHLPQWAACIIKVLPLTPASQCIRAAALDKPFPWISLLMLILWALVLFGAASKVVKRAST